MQKLLNTYLQNSKSFLLAGISGLFIIVNYNWIRSAGTPIFTEHYSTKLLPFAGVCTIILLIPTISIYNWSLNKFNIRKTFFFSSIISIFIFLTLFFLLKNHVKEAAFFLYIFSPIYIMVLIEQVWSYFNSVHDKESARVLSGPLMGLSSLAATFSGLFLKEYASTIGTYNVILYASSFLIIPMTCMSIALKDIKIIKKEDENSWSGLTHLRNNKMLKALFLIVIFSQMYAAFTDFQFKAFVTEEILGKDQRTAFFAGFYSKVNFISLILQFIVTPIVLSNISLKYIHFSIPLIHTFFALLVILNPELQYISITYIVFKTIDYSLYKGAKEMIYIPFTKVVKYQAKSFIDILGYRLGSALIAIPFAIIFFFQKDFPIRQLLPMSAIVLTFWMGTAYYLFRTLGKKA